jgi:hypothetical protein
LFKKWSYNDTLAFEDLRLRFKNWVELVPLGTGDEDVNAISSRFFSPKGKSKTIQFCPGKGLELYLELAYSRYAEIMLRLEELEEGMVCFFDVVIVLLYSTNAVQIQPGPAAQKMSISYITESDQQEPFVSGTDSLLPSIAVVQKGRKRQRSVRL